MFVAPSVVHDCHCFLRNATATARSAHVTTPCARSVAPLVHPSTVSGYLRRAPTFHWLHQIDGAGSVDFRCRRSQQTFTCTATVTESERSNELFPLSMSYLHPTRTPFIVCRCGTDAVPTRKTLPKNFDVAGTEQRLYDWYEEAFVLLPFRLHIAEQACLSVPCNQQASSQLVTWQVGAKRHVPAKEHRHWRALLHGYATPKCDWQAAHGSCNVCYLARHHDALCQDV